MPGCFLYSILENIVFLWVASPLLSGSNLQAKQILIIRTLLNDRVSWDLPSWYSEDVGKQPEYWLEESGSIWFLFYKNDSGSMQRIFSIARAGPRLFCFLHGSLEKMIRLKLCGSSAGSKSEYTGWWLDWTLNEVKVFISEIIAVKFSMLSFQFIIFFYNQILLSCEKHSQLKKCLLNE